MKRHIIYVLCLSLILLPTLAGCASAGAGLHGGPNNEAHDAYTQLLLQKPPDTLTEEEILYLQAVQQQKQARYTEMIFMLGASSFLLGILLLASVVTPDSQQ